MFYVDNRGYSLDKTRLTTVDAFLTDMHAMLCICCHAGL